MNIVRAFPNTSHFLQTILTLRTSLSSDTVGPMEQAWAILKQAQLNWAERNHFASAALPERESAGSPMAPADSASSSGGSAKTTGDWSELDRSQKRGAEILQIIPTQWFLVACQRYRKRRVRYARSR